MQQQEEIHLDSDIIKNPNKTIVDWAEQRLKILGSKTFDVIALQPVSLFAPKLPDGSMANLHSLVLAQTGAGKTTLIKLVGEITHNPLYFNDITKAELIEEIYSIPDFTALCWDVNIIFHDPDLVKILEGLSGEEKFIDSRNMRRKRNFSVNSVFVGAGLPSSLTKYYALGLMRRIIPIVVFYSEEEDELIRKHIAERFTAKKELISSEKIKLYYKKIINIQKGKDNNHKRITNYSIKERFVNELYETHNDLLYKLKNQIPEDITLYSELISGSRYMCNNAILNMFNRKIYDEGDKVFIEINDNDFEFGKQLMIREIETKATIYKLDSMAQKNKDLLRLYKSIMNNENLNDTVKRIAEIFISREMNKRGKKWTNGAT